MDQRRTVGSVVEKVHKYRELARSVGDEETARRIRGLAAELKQRARALAKADEDIIRARAREIWEETGRPAGRDEEFWFQAEREFREAEALAEQIHDEPLA